MKNLTRITTAILLSAALMCACSKEGEKGDKGDKGETGAAGAKGDKGDQGIQGIAGNAGVMMYTFGSQTFTAVANYIFPVAIEDVGKNLIYAYYGSSIANRWNPVPGMDGMSFLLNYFLERETATSTAMRIERYRYPAGGFATTSITWPEFRIIVVPIPAGNIISAGTAAAAKGAAPDYSNYAEVAEYYGLPQ